jgi:hypothetical protein
MELGTTAGKRLGIQMKKGFPSSREALFGHGIFSETGKTGFPESGY